MFMFFSVQPICLHADRTDKVDGWGSPSVEWVQKAFHPYLILDLDLYDQQPIFNSTETETGDNYDWGVVEKGLIGRRKIVVFNDGIGGEEEESEFELVVLIGDEKKQAFSKTLSLKEGEHSDVIEVEFDYDADCEVDRVIIELRKDGFVVNDENRLHC